jgi:hypothetical protein
MKRAQESTLREHGLTPPEWGVMTHLRLGSDDCSSSPGELATDLELSSGAMTSRLDTLEQAGFVRRLPDPDDRRGVVVELTEKGRDAWDVGHVQGRGRRSLRRRSPGERQLKCCCGSFSSASGLLSRSDADRQDGSPAVVRVGPHLGTCTPGAAVASQVVAHGSAVDAAITVPSTANSTRATGPIVCARQSTTPVTVCPSARFCAVTCGGGSGFGCGFGCGFGLGCGFGFGWGFGSGEAWASGRVSSSAAGGFDDDASGRRRFAVRPSRATAASVIQSGRRGLCASSSASCRARRGHG